MFANNANTSYNLSKLKKNLASVSTNLKQIYDGRNGLQTADHVASLSDASLDALDEGLVGLDRGGDAAPDLVPDRGQVVLHGHGRHGDGQDNQEEENGGFHFLNLKIIVFLKFKLFATDLLHLKKKSVIVLHVL
jgi:hypothetical protein